MHHLEVPDSDAGLRLERHQALGKEIMARVLSPIIIIARRTEGQIDVSQLLVAAHDRPDIRIASMLPGVVLPRFDAWLFALRHSMEHPPLLAGPRIKASDVTWRHGFHAWIVNDRRPHNDDIATDNGRGSDAIQRGVNRTVQALRQIDAAMRAEFCDRLSRFGVEGNELRIPRTNKNALPLPVRPIGDAAVHESEIGGRSLLVALRVISPDGLPGTGVNGCHLAQ